MSNDQFALDLMQKVWAIGNRHGPNSQRKAEIQVAIAEAFAKVVPQVPEGWQLMPVELDERMLLVSDAVVMDWDDSIAACPSWDQLQALYSAWLAAAPKGGEE